MQKGVSISVQLFIQGEDAPAHDFTQTGRDVALQVLQQGLQHYQGPYAIQVQKLTPIEGDDSDESESGDALDVTPLLSYTPSGTQSASPAQGAPSAPSTAPAVPGPPAASQPSAQPHPQAPSSPPPHPDQPEQSEQPGHPEKHHFWDRSSD